jgi:murein DD-endopeptidase MepM/ murein hydrolase activator NlpD
MHLSRAFVGSLAAIAVLFLLGVAFAPHLAFQVRSQRAEITELSQANEELRHQRARFEDALDDVTERLARFEAATGEMASALGVEELPSTRPAAGGPAAGGVPDGGHTLLGEELGAVRSRTEALEASFEELDRAFARRSRQLASTPNRMPVDGWFSHGYGWRRDPFTGSRQFHRGMDIVADAGTPIVAPADGVVSRALRVSDLGKTLDISHGFGYVSRYAHLSEVLVRPGQRIHRGEIIGRVGSTGRSTGPHLHYEVFRDGRRVNPWKYLGQKGS